jgi:methanogenic corrinoid protein MtbC1
MVNLKDISSSLQSGKGKETADLIIRAFEENYSVESIVKQGLIPGMTEMKSKLTKQEILVPELVVAARAMNIGIKTLRPLIASTSAAPKGTVTIGTVKGDMYDIDKNLIAVTMEGIGLRVIDMGIGVSPERFIETVAKEKARVIVCCANLTTTMPQLKSVVQALAFAGIRNKIKLLVTGAPVTEKYCQVIGADLYAPDTISAAEMAAAALAELSEPLGNFDLSMEITDE